MSSSIVDFFPGCMTGLPERMKLSSAELNQKVVGGIVFLKTFLNQDCLLITSELNLYATKNYRCFNFMKENRDINNKKLKLLKKSFKDDGYKLTIIYVNEKLEIIDGQHRYLVIKEMNLPLYFCIMPGWSVSDVHTLNLNASNWSDIDFLKSYTREGNAHYKRLQDFYESHEFNLSLCIGLLSGRGRISQERRRNFREGKLKISTKQVDQAERLAEQIFEIGHVHHPKGWRGREFVGACMVMFFTPGYDHERMVKQLNEYPDALLAQAKTMRVQEYISILEAKYNRKLGRANRIDFKARLELV